MSGTTTALSAEQAAVLAQLARHEETGASSGFAHRRALAVPPGSSTLGELMRDGLTERCQLLCGTYYRITAAGRRELRKLDPEPTCRTRR